MNNLVNDGLRSTCVLGMLVGTVAACGGANTTPGSGPTKAAAPAASGAPASSAGATAASTGTGTGGAPGPEQINNVLKSHSRELKACYDREKDRGMAYKGDTKFRVKLDPSGKVTDVQGVDVPPAGEFLSSCVSESMKTWTFPSSSKGGSLTFAVPW